MESNAPTLTSAPNPSIPVQPTLGLLASTLWDRIIAEHVPLATEGMERAARDSVPVTIDPAIRLPTAPTILTA